MTQKRMMHTRLLVDNAVYFMHRIDRCRWFATVVRILKYSSKALWYSWEKTRRRNNWSICSLVLSGWMWLSSLNTHPIRNHWPSFDTYLTRLFTSSSALTRYSFIFVMLSWIRNNISEIKEPWFKCCERYFSTVVEYNSDGWERRKGLFIQVIYNRFIAALDFVVKTVLLTHVVA